MTLLELPVGMKATVVGFVGFGHFVRRANNMGFHVGAKVKKLQRFGWHSLMQVGDCKIGLGRGATRKIIVKPENGEVKK
jgi:Fe2+ transport system protein FeoA